jgi:hypothetical protein
MSFAIRPLNMTWNVGPKAASLLTQCGSMSSATQRLAIGLTGLALRPTIDYYNGQVDPQTRKTAAIKTAVKVAITVFNGVLTRYAAERYGLYLAKKGIIQPLTHSMNPEAFRQGMATAVSFLATVLTTFTLDIPLINYGLNIALEKFLGPKSLDPKAPSPKANAPAQQADQFLPGSPR